MISQATPWAFTFKIHPRPIPHQPYNYLCWHLCLLSLHTAKLDGQCVGIAFQLATKTSNLKDPPVYLQLNRCPPWLQGRPLFLASYCMCAISCVRVKIDLVSSVNTTTVHLMTRTTLYRMTNSQTIIQHNRLKLVLFPVQNRILHPGPFKTCPFIFLWNGWLLVGTRSRLVKWVDWGRVSLT